MGCMRCGGDHAAAKCEKSRQEKPICANPAGPHTANDKRRAVFRWKPSAKGLKGPLQSPQGKDLRRPEATKILKDPIQLFPRQHHGGKTRPPRPIVKPKPNTASAQEEHTGLKQQEHEIEEEKEDATTAATAIAATVSATNGTEGGRTLPRGESEKIKAARGRAALSNYQQTTTATTTARLYSPTPTTPTTSKAGREITNTSHHIRSDPRDGQPEDSDVKRDQSFDIHTPRDQGRTGPDAEYSTGPDTHANVLNLRILYWNPGGIIGKTRELRNLTQLEDIHIIILGKTKLRPQQELKISNFFAYGRDEISAREPAYRGTTVLIRRDVMHEVEQFTSFETMRSMGIRVGSSDYEIRLFVAYRPPGTRMCVQDIRSIFKGPTPTFIIGNLNAKHKAWGSHASRASRLLMEDAERQGYEVLGPDTPTHVPTDMRHRPDVLDIVLGHNIRRSMRVEVVYGMDRQHLPILVTVGTGTSNSPQIAARQQLGELPNVLVSVASGILLRDCP
ncbi:Probable RNA-directed DNA polymerase from transposon BS [Eumeta japonica]|uniref:Probable RNA-directed DNA polymerase from transposon BS n=1 Tax=Eumeta variegata TaxID=151549 RepID=A0A4C1U1Q8_EUMVA|nr:Probable RNA-directed DNA polymerase from transposon BS [Eumeta japonica]